MATGSQDSGPVDFSSLGGSPTSAVTSTATAAPPQPDATSGPVNFSSLGGRPVNSDVSAAATAAQTTPPAAPEQPWYVNTLNKVGEVGGKALFGDNTAAAAPLSPTQSSEMSGLADIAQGNFTQGISKIKHAEAIHVVAGSPIEKLIQKFKPDFVGGVTPSQAEIQDRQNKAGLESPAVDAAQFIDKNQHPVLKALTEAAQSMTSPANVAVMISTGGMGMVESPKALSVANRLISAGFTAQAVGQAYKNLKEFKTAYDKGDANDALYQLTHAVTSGTMAYLAGSHAAGKPALEGAPQDAAAAVGQAADTIKGALDERAAAKANRVSGEDMIAANKDFKKAVPPTKTNSYDDNDLAVVNNYLETHHQAVEPIRSTQHVVDALDHSVEGIENKVSDHVKIIPNEPIATNVLDDVRSALEQNERGDEFVKAGMKEIEGLDLADMNMARADNVRRQLNAENQAILKKNNYDLAAARAGDPGFAAREAAAESLRNGIYNQLEAHGIEGVRELRQEEGSLLKVRNAAQAQLYNGDKVLKGTGGAGKVRELAGVGVRAATTAAGAGLGASVGGVTGAMVGGGVGAAAGEMARKAIVPPDLTRDELLERRFNNYKAATGTPTEPTVNLHAPAEPEIPAGTQQEIPPPVPKATPGQPEQPSLFGTTTTEPSQQSPMVERQLLQQKIRPLQAILESPTATAAEKIEAARQIAKLGLGQFANPEIPESGVTQEEKATAAQAPLNPTKATGESALGSKTTLETRQPENQDIYTKAGAQKLADHVGAKVVGSVAEKGVSTHDLDLRVDTYDQPKIEALMKAKGFEPIGSSVVSPEEAKASGKNFGTTDTTDWSRAHHFESVSEPRKKVDIWHTEPSEGRAEGYIHPDTLAEPMRDIPASARPGGTTSQTIHEHEFGGHLANAAIEGFSADHIIGSDHPTAGRRTIAAVVVNWDGIDKGPNGGLVKSSVKDNIHKIMSVTMGGAAQDELNGIPFKDNKGLSGDTRFARQIAKAVGFTPEQTDGLIQAGLDRARKNLTQPGMQDTIKSNAAVRETNLEPGLIASPERTKGLVNEFRRIHEQNGNTVGQAHGETEAVQGNASGTAAEGPRNGPKDVTGGEARPAGQSFEVQRGLKEYSTGDAKVDEMIKSAGAIPAGIHLGMVSFHDPMTGSTLSLRPGTEVTPEVLTNHLDESREKFGIKTALATEKEAEPGISLKTRLGVSRKLDENEFKDWFGKSKMVDEKGAPIVAYHGTTSPIDFDEFSTEGAPHDEEGNPIIGSSGDPNAYLGAHFAIGDNAARIASKFAENKEGWMRSRYEGEGAKPRVIPVHLKIENPAEFKTEDGLNRFIEAGKISDEEALNAAMRSDGIDDPEDGGDEVDSWLNKYDTDEAFRQEQNNWILSQNSDSLGYSDESDFKNQLAQELGEQAKQRFIQKGYDGIVYRNQVEGGKAAIAFSPEQILHAIPNAEAVKKAFPNSAEGPTTPEIAEKAVNESKKSGGGFVADMRTGKPTDTGFLVEVAPEKRLTLDHPATPKDLQKFYNDNRQLFKQHPELRIGGYQNELNISAHTDNQQTAEQLARKLDQKSVWDVKRGQEIPTGGQGKTTKFADYPFDQRIKELRHNE